MSSVEVLVVGAGPAGLSAARASAETGASTMMVDESPQPGGQIWRAHHGRPHPLAIPWIEVLANLGVEQRKGALFDLPEAGRAAILTDSGPMIIRYRSLVVATGARELFLPFPGWTLPGVYGVGGVQAMAKGGLNLQDRRVVIAGSGPLLLAVASGLRGMGAQIPLIAEQADRTRVASLLATLAGVPAKALQAAALKWELRGVPYRLGVWPVQALGEGRLEAVRLTDGRREWTIECDFLACSFGLVPNTELASLAGCRLNAGFVQVDERQRTTSPGVFAAGEATGIGGHSKAVAEGRVAGFAAAGDPIQADRAAVAARRERRFERALAKAFALRTEVAALAAPDTVVCRCEDVPRCALQDQPGWRAAKLHTRVGMGPCQGRICGPIAETIFGWSRERIQPPLMPVPLSALADAYSAHDQEEND
jgi:D-hydroxyproline dehydrogenase subunit alpha